jgi:hypothetical protein
MTRELIGQGALDAFDVGAPAAFQSSPPSCSRSIDPFIRLAYLAGVESGELSRICVERMKGSTSTGEAIAQHATHYRKWGRWVKAEAL